MSGHIQSDRINRSLIVVGSKGVLLFKNFVHTFLNLQQLGFAAGFPN
jgi:hypothetical protein